MPSSTATHAFVRRAGRILLWALPLLLGGCGRGPRVTIPLQESAGQQYKYADDYRESSNIALMTDVKRIMKTRTVVREHYRKVYELFPADRKATPLAKLEVIEMDTGLDTPRAKPAKGEIRAGIKQLQKLAEEYPEFDYIQAKSVFDQGLCHQKLFEYAPAMTCFKQVRDKYLTYDKDKNIRDLARLSAYYYNQSHTNE